MPNTRPHPHAWRALLPQVAAILAAGSGLGVVCNELSGSGRVSYFGFRKQDVLESRLAKAVEHVKDIPPVPAAAKPLEVVFFFAECEECKIVRGKVLPEIRRVFGDAIVIREHDCDDMENYKLLLDYEKRFGSDENEMLKMFIGERRYLAGAKQMVEQAIAVIGQALKARREAGDGG